MHAHHGGGIDLRDGRELEDLPGVTAVPRQLCRRGRELVPGLTALEGEEHAALDQEGEGPAREPRHRRDGPSRHHIGVERTCDVLRPAAKDLDVVQPHQRCDVLEPGDPPLHRLQQDDPHPRPHRREHHTGKPGARTDIHQGPRLREERRHGCGVEQVTLPQPWDLARTEQATEHTFGGQRLTEGRDRCMRLTEERDDLGIRCVDARIALVLAMMFHVKRQEGRTTT